MWYFTDATLPYPRRACPCGSAARRHGTSGRFGRARVPGSRGQDAGSREDPGDAEPRQGRALLGQSSPRRGHTDAHGSPRRRSRLGGGASAARHRVPVVGCAGSDGRGRGRTSSGARDQSRVRACALLSRPHLPRSRPQRARAGRAPGRARHGATQCTVPDLARRSRTATEEPARARARCCSSRWRSTPPRVKRTTTWASSSSI